MSKGHLKKKVSSLLLALAMVVTSFPVISTQAYAAELPDSTQFAAVDELRAFNTDDSDGAKNPAKIYFGSNNQQWWIAGSQNNNLTLFAARSMGEGKFSTAESEKIYGEQNVYANHYGASELKGTVKYLETSYFSVAEQGLMNDTAVYTNDTKNGSIYSTTDKLYLAYGDFFDQYITVGRNNPDNLSRGLHVDKEYWGDDGDFWLRAPYSGVRTYALTALPGVVVESKLVTSDYAIKPAFELNLSNVLFASAAPAASADGDLILQDTDGAGAFTLRYKADTLGSVSISYDKSKVTLADVPSDTYLVVQNSNGAKAKQITNEKEVLASDIGLNNFANCKVWLETTKDRITYAVSAIDEPLGIQGGVRGRDYIYENGIIKFLRDGDYTVIGNGSFTSNRIIVEDNVTGSLTLRNVNINTENSSCVEVKGTVNLTIWLEGENNLRVNTHDPAALQFENVTTGSLIIDSKSNGRLTAVGWNGAGIGGSMWGAPKNLIFRGGIIDATSYRSATGIGKGWLSSEDSEITIEGGTIYSKTVYESNKGLGGTENSLITVKGGYVDCGITGNAVISSGYVAGNISGTVKDDRGSDLKKVDIPLVMDDVKEIWVDDINQNINHIFSDSPLHLYLSDGSHKVKIVDSNGNEKTYNVNDKADGNDFIEMPTNLSATYDENLKLSDIDLSGTGWVWIDGDVKLNAGTYQYQASYYTAHLDSIVDFSNVNGYDPINRRVVREIEVKIDKAESQVNINTPSIDKVYDGNPVKEPEYTTFGSDGKVTVTWQEKESSKKSSWKDLESAPSKAGNYRVVLTLAGNDNYKGASASLEFVISKTENAWKEALSIKGWTYGDTASEPSAEANFGEVTFTYSSEENGIYKEETPENAGTWYVKASVSGTESYAGLESLPVSFVIAKADTILEFEKENLDKPYDKAVISEPSIKKTGSANEITFTWYIAEGDGWKKLDDAPSEAGRYKVVAGVEEDSNHNGASIEKEFYIIKAANAWKEELSIAGWTYGENANEPSAEADFGDVTFTYSSEENGTYTTEVPKNAGMWYVKASVSGTESYAGLESLPVSFVITKAESRVKFKDDVSFDKIYDTNEVIVTENHIEKSGSEAAVGFIFEKQIGDEWKTVEAAAEAGKYRVTAALAEDKNHTAFESEPLEFTIGKADSQLNIKIVSLDKSYDGNPVKAPEYTTSGSDGEVTVTWQEKESSKKSSWKDLESAPSKAGNYRVVLTLAGNDNYKGASASLEFVISKTENAWKEALSIKGWTYGDTASEPSAEANFGEVTFTYSSEENGTYTNEVPKNAGTWYVKATVEGTDDYSRLTSLPVSFEIAKAVPSPEKITGLVLGQGQPLSNIELPKQFKWVDETLTAGDLGIHTFKAVYTPEDADNYETIEVEIEVEVVPAPIAINHVPIISASDKTLTIGDRFDPLEDVTVTDKEDGDLTSKIKVINNTVDTNKAGIYEVTYRITDSLGASVTKTIKVIVKAKEITVTPDLDKPDNDKASGGAKTGDSRNLILWGMLLLGSSAVMLQGVYRKKRKIKQ